MKTRAQGTLAVSCTVCELFRIVVLVQMEEQLCLGSPLLVVWEETEQDTIDLSL